jgi:hypothetical protein
MLLVELPFDSLFVPATLVALLGFRQVTVQ